MGVNADVQEHLTEYGVHWNFFFTLGCLPVLGIAISPLREYIGWTPLALLLAFGQWSPAVGPPSADMQPTRSPCHGLAFKPGYFRPSESASSG